MRMELPGSSSGATVSPPPVQHQSSNAPTKSTPDTSPTKAWADAVAQAKANSPQPHVTVKPGDTLTAIASSHNDTLPSVEDVNPQIFCPNLIRSGDTVYLPKKTPAQVVTGVDNSQIKPIITAMANANSADQGLQSPLPVHDPGLRSDAQTQSTNSWNTVEQTTFNMLINHNGGAFPEQAGAAEVRQLNALEPGNAKFAAANNAALAKATQRWAQMGITKPQLGPIIDAYNNVKQINQDLQNPLFSHNHSIVSDLNAAEQQANNRLNAAIEKSLMAAANQAGKDPKARSQAMTERAANIQLAGPQDPAFQTAVDTANYDLQVNKPAEAVATAYAKSGAEAAAQALKTGTQNAGNSYYAGQIIRQSQDTIDSITKDMGSLASHEPRGSRGIRGLTPAETEFNQIYANLSQSVAAANTITTSGSLSPGGKTAADIVGNSVAANTPKNLMPWQSGVYGIAVTNAISNGDGVALTLATAAALKRQGNADLASLLTGDAATGLQGLASKTSSDVTDFATTTADLHQLRAAWGPFMTESQLVKATNGYLADHPDVRQKADAELGTISQDGDAIAEAESAWHSYGGQLNGIDGRGDLSAAAKSLTGNNTSAAFAVSQSTGVNNAIATALGPAMPSQAGGGSVAQSLLTSPAWSLSRSWRSDISALYKWRNAQAKIASQTEPHGSTKLTTLSAIGLGLTVENAVANGLPMSSPQQVASSYYTVLGFPKYTGELISGFAKNTIIQNYLNGKVGFELKNIKGKDALFLGKTNLTNLTKTWGFKALGSAYYGFGALASVLEAEDNFKNGDVTGTVLNGFEAFGNVLNATKPLFEEALGEVAGEAASAVGSFIGLGAAAGTLIYDGIKSAQQHQAYLSDSSKFLQRGLGLNSGVADEIAIDGPPALNALQAYATNYHMPLEQLLQKLQGERNANLPGFDGEPAAQFFIDEAAGMPTLPGGGYAVSRPGDGPGKVGTHEVTSNGIKGISAKVKVPNQADSLLQLKYWADYLFGKNRLG